MCKVTPLQWGMVAIFVVAIWLAETQTLIGSLLRSFSATVYP